MDSFEFGVKLNVMVNKVNKVGIRVYVNKTKTIFFGWKTVKTKNT